MVSCSFGEVRLRAVDASAASGVPCRALAQAQPDPWGFEEEPEETWQDILRPQVADIVLTVAFLAFAMVSFFRKSVPLKYITFALSVGYMGFYKSNLISVVNIFGVMDWNLPIVKHNVMWYVFAHLHRGVDGALGPPVLRQDLRATAR